MQPRSNLFGYAAVSACLLIAVAMALAIERAAAHFHLDQVASQIVVSVPGGDFSRNQVLSELSELERRPVGNELIALHFGGSSLYRNIDLQTLRASLAELNGEPVHNVLLGSIGQRILDAFDILTLPELRSVKKAAVFFTWSGLRFVEDPLRMVKRSMSLDRMAWPPTVTESLVDRCCGSRRPINIPELPEVNDELDRFARQSLGGGSRLKLADAAHAGRNRLISQVYRALLGIRSPVDLNRVHKNVDPSLMHRQEQAFLTTLSSQQFEKQFQANLSAVRILIKLCRSRNWSFTIVELPQTKLLLQFPKLGDKMSELRTRLQQFARVEQVAYIEAVDSAQLNDTMFHDHIHVLGGTPQIIATKIYAAAIKAAGQ